MRCGKPEHQQGEKCAAKNAKCKECHKIGHFYKVCQSSKRTRRANLAQAIPQDEDDTHIDEYEDHQDSNRLRTQKLRSSEVKHRSGNQDKNTADSQKQKKLSFRPHLLIMMKETLSGTILSINFHLTLST